jgi:hypothetical protein
MSGARRAWFRVASHLHTSVARLQCELSYSEFLEWLEYLREEETKEHWYLAQIAAEVRRSFVTAPGQIKVTDFLLRSREEKKVQWEKSKEIWTSALGVRLPASN